MRETDEIYRKKSCDLCDKVAYEKWNGTKAVLDGGFTRIEEFEKSGFGSVVICFYTIDCLVNGRQEIKLCPECAKKLDKALTKILQEIKSGNDQN